MFTPLTAFAGECPPHSSVPKRAPTKKMDFLCRQTATNQLQVPCALTVEKRLFRATAIMIARCYGRGERRTLIWRTTKAPGTKIMSPESHGAGDKQFFRATVIMTARCFGLGEHCQKANEVSHYNFDSGRPTATVRATEPGRPDSD